MTIAPGCPSVPDLHLPCPPGRLAVWAVTLATRVRWLADDRLCARHWTGRTPAGIARRRVPRTKRRPVMTVRGPLPAPPPPAGALYDARRGVYYAKPVLRGWLHLLWFAASLAGGSLLLARAHGATAPVFPLPRPFPRRRVKAQLTSVTAGQWTNAAMLPLFRPGPPTSVLSVGFLCRHAHSRARCGLSVGPPQPLRPHSFRAAARASSVRR